MPAASCSLRAAAAAAAAAITVVVMTSLLLPMTPPASRAPAGVCIATAAGLGSIAARLGPNHRLLQWRRAAAAAAAAAAASLPMAAAAAAHASARARLPLHPSQARALLLQPAVGWVAPAAGGECIWVLLLLHMGLTGCADACAVLPAFGRHAVGHSQHRCCCCRGSCTGPSSTVAGIERARAC